MQTACKVLAIALFSIIPMLTAYSIDQAPASEQERDICTTGHTIDLDRARKLRDLIREQNPSSERLLPLRSSLDESVSRCSSAINGAHAAFLAGLYVGIGAGLSSQQRYDEAIVSYREANSLFERFPHPDVMWLQALQGQVRAELLRGNKAEAENIASVQATLAQEWVKNQRFIAQELSYALSFEADLCDKSGNAICSKNSRKEAKELDESARR